MVASFSAPRQAIGKAVIRLAAPMARRPRPCPWTPKDSGGTASRRSSNRNPSPRDAEELQVTEPGGRHAGRGSWEQHGARHRESEEVGGLLALSAKLVRGEDQVDPAELGPTGRRPHRREGSGGVAAIGVGRETASRLGLDTARHDQSGDEHGGGETPRTLVRPEAQDPSAIDLRRVRSVADGRPQPGRVRAPRCAPTRGRR
jgi:hypothetical protein